jgi:hypothetical protein
MRAQNGTCSIFKGMFDMRRMDRTLAIALVALLGIGGLFEPAEAEEGKGFFTSRKSLGLAFLGSSLLLSKQGLDFRDEADKLYVRYKDAKTPEVADRLYARTNNRDIKSQVSWALAAAFAVSGVRLLLHSSDDTAMKQQRKSWQPISSVGYSLEPQMESRRLGLALKRTFF